MRVATKKKECPRCGLRIAVKNGSRECIQQYKCLSWVSGQQLGCGLQFGDRKKPYYQRYSAEVIAKAIELYLTGMPYKKIAAEVKLRFPLSGTKLSEATILRWVEKYADFAVEAVRGLTMEESAYSISLSVKFASLHPAQVGCWVVEDSRTGWVLAAEAGGSFDPDTAREIVAKSKVPIGPLRGEVDRFTLETDEYHRDLESFPDVLAAIKEELLCDDCFPPKETQPDISLAGPDGESLDALKTMRKRKAFRGGQSMQRFLDGCVVTNNFLTDPDDPDYQTPAECAGVQAPFRSWRDVVNYWAELRVKGQGDGMSTGTSRDTPAGGSARVG